MSDNVYERALEWLDRRGWCQGEEQDDQGRLCAVGALHRALEDLGYSGAHHYDRVRWGLQHTIVGLGYEGEQVWSIPVWNDEYDRTEEDVRLAFKHAAHDVDLATVEPLPPPPPARYVDRLKGTYIHGRSGDGAHGYFGPF